MSSHVVIPVLISFAISLVLGPVVIPFLRKLKMKQTERVEGVQSHLKKAGTPTMGGIMILISVIVTSLFYVKDYPKIVPVLFLTAAFGLIGFLDDYLKVVLKRSDGLMPMQKMFLQIIVTGIFAVYMILFTDVELTLLVPFSGGYYWDIGWVAVPLLFVAVIGTGILGGILAPFLIKVFHITDPVAAGLAIGASSHAVGTSKAIEIGEVEGAMSGLAIGICGIITVLFSMLIRL